MKVFSSESVSKIGIGRLRRASKEDVRRAFVDHREELEWLARFLIPDPDVAAACVVDACAIATAHNDVFEYWLDTWVRRATIRSAVDMQQARLKQLAAAYEHNPCPHGNHAWLSPEQLLLVYVRSDELATRLDLLCRTALVVRGIEKYSLVECALILGMTRTAVEAAYCAALELLNTVSREIVVDLEAGVVACD
jgi:DNA-directed RNA polymerase specialized sigma24 family protein